MNNAPKLNKLFSFFILITVILSTIFAKFSYAGVNDYVIILVDGNSNSTPLWNLSSTAKRYIATGESTSGTMVFSKRSESQCERRSSDQILEENFYGTNGHIPPGIYFLDYYRIDDDNIRHRLTLSDSKSGTTIVTADGVTRTYIQMHVAFNNNLEFHKQISQGCLTFDTKNFYKLFPDYYFTPADSPFTSTYNNGIPYTYYGSGNILVFVTDNRNQETNDNQNTLFNNILTGQEGGLTANLFSNNSDDLQDLRTDWYIVGSPTISGPTNPTEFRSEN